ncbi:hypothetical protein Bca52824_064229 [Brassica carinata]|uniref:Uncharacterized protein n=1 Tax=Brassica carinata TaxID=52824 RepID=A0A8X7QFZ0_BRACI|nr:hypothetical protein Bca52824_064229 [Brassica carinata]
MVKSLKTLVYSTEGPWDKYITPKAIRTNTNNVLSEKIKYSEYNYHRDVIRLWTTT